MTFLPIVVRELRVAARRSSTFHLRSWTVILATLVSCGALILADVTQPRAIGDRLFFLLSHYLFGLCLIAGPLLTADSLSVEKREGTLGFLFLTDLTGYDVVLGKFAATALNAFYGLAALLPFLGLPLVLGGVTGAEFWRQALALGNTLFLSLSAGICVSAFAREAQGAMGRTLGLVLGLSILPPLCGELGRLVGLSAVWSSVASLSPYHSFSHAFEARYFTRAQEYWAGLAGTHLLGWAGLATASLALRGQWRALGAESRPAAGWRCWWRASRGGPAQRALLLPINPVLWLVGYDAAMRWTIWSVVGLWGATMVLGSWLSPSEPLWAFVAGKVMGFLLKFLLAVQVGRFFVEARRDGTLELVLSTPLRGSEILRGQWLALRRLFLPPLAAVVAFGTVPVLAMIVAGTPSSAPQMGPALFAMSGGMMLVGWSIFTFAADAYAIYWFGTWLALSMKRPAYAPGMTILVVLVVPSVFSFCWLDLIADLVFAIWGYTSLQQDLRRILARR